MTTDEKCEVLKRMIASLFESVKLQGDQIATLQEKVKRLEQNESDLQDDGR